MARALRRVLLPACSLHKFGYTYMYADYSRYYVDSTLHSPALTRMGVVGGGAQGSLGQVAFQPRTAAAHRSSREGKTDNAGAGGGAGLQTQTSMWIS